VTPPLLTSAGFHVVRIEARRAERLPEFEEVREQVQRDFFRGRAALAFSVWLRSVDAWARVERFIFQEDGGDLPQDYFPLPPRK
jgi:parvulin-like peptidyl-prolyl isomerase